MGKGGKDVGGMGLRNEEGNGGERVNGERRGERWYRTERAWKMGVCCWCACFAGCWIPLVEVEEQIG